MTESELIYEILLSLRDQRSIRLESSKMPMYQPTIRKMVTLGLISQSNDANTLTQRGYEVIDAGGFDQWKIAVENWEQKSDQTTLASVQAEVDAARSFRSVTYIVSIAGFCAFTTTVLSVLQYRASTLTDKKISAMNQEINALKSQLKVLTRSRPTQTATRTNTPPPVDTIPSSKASRK